MFDFNLLDEEQRQEFELSFYEVWKKRLKFGYRFDLDSPCPHSRPWLQDKAFHDICSIEKLAELYFDSIVVEIELDCYMNI